VIRFWNIGVIENLEGVAEMILAELDICRSVRVRGVEWTAPLLEGAKTLTFPASPGPFLSRRERRFFGSDDV